MAEGSTSINPSMSIWTAVLFIISAAAFGMAVYLIVKKEEDSNQGDNGGGEGAGKSGFRASFLNSNLITLNTANTALVGWKTTEIDDYDPKSFDPNTGIFTATSDGAYTINFTVGMGKDIGASTFSLMRTPEGGESISIGTINIPALSTENLEFSIEINLQKNDQLFITGYLPTAGGLKNYDTTVENSLDYFDGLVLEPRAILADSNDTVDGPIFTCQSVPPAEYQRMVQFPAQNGTDLAPDIGTISGFAFQNNNYETVDDGKGFQLNTTYNSTSDGSGVGATFRVLTLSGNDEDKQAGIVQVVTPGSGYAGGDTVTIENPSGTSISLTVDTLQGPILDLQNTGLPHRAAVSVVTSATGVSDNAILELVPVSLPVTNYFEGGFVSQTVDTQVGGGSGATVLIQYETGNPQMLGVYLAEGGSGYDVSDTVTIEYSDPSGVLTDLGVTITGVARTNTMQNQLITPLPRSPKVLWDLGSENKGPVASVKLNQAGYQYNDVNLQTTNINGTGTGLVVTGGEGSFIGSGKIIADLDIFSPGTGYVIGDTFSVNGNTVSENLDQTVRATGEVLLVTQAKAMFYNETDPSMAIAEVSDPFHSLSVGDTFTYSTPSDSIGKVIVATELFPVSSVVSSATFTVTQN